MSNENKLDWMQVEELKRRVDFRELAQDSTFEEFLEKHWKLKVEDLSPNELAAHKKAFESVLRTLSWFKVDEGDEFKLRVRITDPKLAQIILASMYEEGVESLPGMKITEIDKDSNAVLANQLRMLAHRLDIGDIKM